MAITQEEVINLIDTVGGVVLDSAKKENFTFVAFSKYSNVLSSKNNYLVYLQENGEMFQLINGIGDPKSIGISDMDLLNSILLNHNNDTKFGTWELDREDNSIQHTVEIPLEDNTLTEKQFKRIINLSEQSTVEFMKMAHDVMSTQLQSGI